MFHKLRFLMKHSWREFLDAELLRDGNYDVITSGQQFYDGQDLSVLVPDTGEEVLAEGGYVAGQVWQSLFGNWVYQNPPALNPSVVLNHWPTAFRASGVYIDGAFRLENDPIYPHSVDHLNGRIIFDAALPLGTTVHADFTYKTVRILSLREFNNQLSQGILEQQYKTNPFSAGHMVYPSGTNRVYPLPIIFVENMGRTFSNYQLGDRSLVCKDELVCEIWALDESTRDNLIDLVSYQQRKSFPIINYNMAPFPLSGIKNELSPAYVPYISLAQNEPLPGPAFSGVNPIAYRGFIEETEVADLDSFFTNSATQQDVFER
ncbi:MAG: hypothetical protein V3T23_10330, partial [Nitrososphaerales archaeon]